ncbi:Ig-like domain repeat protein [Actinoplanes sp. NEAU-A12]|uniref:Ig-like domain repeat protein n=1 Tax=Actinoplanes sandaracinus TaxID=3045177 RepID=A0ABT6WZH2_9ACTN|nr:immunoglobulin-like domain-containing protein [Actinoplanes sandaracinus]MDI6105143.1 Ig-like domain repeat protein [Actinoplanes sandaracinus]
MPSTTAFLLFSLTVPSPALAENAANAKNAAEITDGLVLRYKLDEKSGATAVDSSGHDRNGTVAGTATWTGGEGLAFDGSSTYVKVPNNIMSGLDSISVSFDVFVDPDQPTPYFLYGFGNTSGSTGYGDGYLFTTGNSFRTAIATGNWSTEQTTGPTAAKVLDRGSWKHIAYTQTGTTGTLYEDGTPIATNASVTIKPGAIGAGTTTANYIGKSNYNGDRLLKGKIKDFRVYDRALDGTELRTLADPVVSAELAADRAALSLGDTSALAADLNLPATAPFGSKLTWATSDASVITTAGVVTRPESGKPDATATLTATLTRGSLSATKSFTVTVRPQLGAEDAVKVAAAGLSVHNIDDVRGNLTLPSSGAHNTTVTWSSDRPEIIDGTGVVHRPAAGKGAASVALTATVKVGQASATRTLTATVPELPPARAKTGYLFSYFTGEGTADGEQLYFGVSKANDPLSYREVNNAKPVLTSTLGTKGLRDPFIIRSPEGDKFYQIATDLKIHGNGNWDASQRTGSKSIMVWESTDLVNWTDQRLVKVSPDTAGNTWAPEAYYDPTLGAYVVFWASKLYDAADTGHTGGTYNKMMYATTRDFHTFSEAKVWVDPGYSVIDSTMIDHNGTYYRFTKDERNNSSTSPCSKFIIEEKSTSILSTDYSFVKDCIGAGGVSAGEGPLVFKSNTEDRWYLFVDEYGGQGYVPFTSTDLEAGQWTKAPSYSLPKRPRHGTVLPVTQEEYDRLLTTYQPNLLVTGVDQLSLTTPVGTAPTLPGQATAKYADGSSSSVAVKWDAVPASAYAKPGRFTVSGVITESQNVKATAVVTVPDAGAPTVSATVTPAEPASGWFTGPATVTVTAGDAVDGPLVPQVRVTRSGEPAGAWTDQPQPLTIDRDGIHLIEYVATDAAGNSSGIGSLTVRVDGTAPVSQATVDAKGRTVVLRSADNDSGVNLVQYSRDGGATWQTYTVPLTAGQAETTVLYRAVDVAGNVETANRAVLPAVGVVLAPSSTKASLVSAKVSYGTAAAVRVTVSGGLQAKPSGTVRVLLGSTAVGSGVLSGGKATIKLAKNIGVGTRKLRVVYAGDDRYTGSAADLTLKVVTASSKTTVTAKPSTVRAGKTVRLTVKVAAASGVKPSGTVQIVVARGNTKIVRTVRLTANGTAVVDLRSLGRTGTYKITAQYRGSSTVTGSTSSVIKVKVVR